MKKLLLSLFTLLLLMVFSIESAVAQKSASTTTYLLSEGACYGFCPIFDLQVTSDGTATFTGKDHCERKGVYQKTLSRETVQNLEKLFAAANFDNLPNEYESMLPDLQPKTIGRRMDGKSKTTTFRENRPESLEAIWRAMREIANSTDGWMPLKPERQANADLKEALTSDDSIQEFQVQLKPDVKIEDWYQANGDRCGLVVSREVSPKSNHWVVALGSDSKCSAEQVSQILQNDNSLMSIDSPKK